MAFPGEDSFFVKSSVGTTHAALIR